MMASLRDLGEKAKKFFANVAQTLPPVQAYNAVKQIRNTPNYGQQLYNTALKATPAYQIQKSLVNSNTGVKPFDYAAQRVGNYVKNNYYQPLVDLPQNIKTVANPQASKLERGLAGFNTAMTPLYALPDPTDFVWGLVNAAKGYQSAKLDKQPLKQRLDTAVKSATMENYTGLGDASTRDPNLRAGLNLAELPLVLGAGFVKGKMDKKRVEMLVGDSRKIDLLLNSVNDYKNMKPAGQQQILQELQLGLEKYVPEAAKSREMRKLAQINTAEWMRQASRLIGTATEAARNQLGTFGMTTSSIRPKDAQAGKLYDTTEKFIKNASTNEKAQMYGKLWGKDNSNISLSELMKAVQKELDNGETPSSFNVLLDQKLNDYGLMYDKTKIFDRLPNGKFIINPEKVDNAITSQLKSYVGSGNNNELIVRGRQPFTNEQLKSVAQQPVYDVPVKKSGDIVKIDVNKIQSTEPTTTSRLYGKAPVEKGPIDVNYNVDTGEYFVTNGHHRLDLQKQYGGRQIDAKVTLVKSVPGTEGGGVMEIKNISQQPLSVAETPVKANVLEQTTTPQTSLIKQTGNQINTPAKNDLLQSVQPSQQIQTQTPVLKQSQTKVKSGGLTDQSVADGSFKFNVADKLYTEGVNRFHPLSKLAKEAGKDAELNRKLAGYYGTGSTADYHLTYELSPILKSTNVEDLRSAAIAMRDAELSGRGIKGSPNQANATKVLEELKAKYGEDGMKKLGDSLNQLYKYQDSIAKRYLVDTGIMSQEAYNKMRMDNSFYVPFKRVMDEVDTNLGIPVKKGAGSVGSQNVIFKIKGSDKEVVDPIQSIVENTYKMVSLGKRQEVAQTIASISKELPELVHRTNISGLKDTISVFENGKKVNYSVPQEVAEAARGMSEESLVTLAKILKIPTDLFRTMTTGINPEFLLPNVARDVQSAIFNTGVNPLKWIAGLAHYAKRDDVYKDFLKSGAKTSRVSLNRPFIEQTAQELAGNGFRIKSPKDVIRGLETLSQYSEQPTRLAVFQDAYQTAIKKGLSVEDALGDAAYWAQEGTVNFARRGSKTPNINAIYAYLNARVQGIDRMIRTVKKEPLKAAARYGVAFLAPSMALYAWNSQNPDYYNPRILSQRDKDDNFIFMLPKPVGEIRYLKIPKAEVGKVVNPVETFLDMARGKGGDVWKSMWSVLKSFSPIDNWGGIIPTAINPLVENAVNKDFYFGNDIVPEYKKNYPKAYQDSPYTSPMYRYAGEKLNTSPAKLQNLVEGYGGGGIRILDNLVSRTLPDKYKSAKNEQGADINRTPILRRFLGGEKKTVEEQIKSDVSRSKAIEFDINDIKAGVKRGDIPMEVGVAKIQELQKQQQELLKSTQSQTSNVQWIQTKEGALKEIDMNFTLPEYKPTGDTLLDKELLTDYRGAITKLKNDVVTAWEAGAITQEEAVKQLEKLTTASNKTKKAKKPKKISIKISKPKRIKFSSVRNFKISKASTPKTPVYKIKKYKVKNIKIAAGLGTQKVKAIKIKPFRNDLARGIKLA